MKSAITPTLHGDIKIDQNHFGMIPVSGEDLKNPLNARNIFFNVDGNVWNVTGLTPYQKFNPDDVTLENGLLYQKIIRENKQFMVEITSFVPTNDRLLELHKVTYKNLSKTPQQVKTVIGIPIFGRSADNLRDHRHVTSLLNRIHIVEHGIINQPSLSFDERGHQENSYAYGVFAKSTHHAKISQYWPKLDEFIGEGQDLFYPRVVSTEYTNEYKINDIISGSEAMGGIEYSRVQLAPNEAMDFIIAFEIHSDLNSLISIQKQLPDLCFETLLEQNKAFWKKDLITTHFNIKDKDLSGWYRHVGIQPLVRRIYGNSFLPHHDYGRGGRGWRDLWQDSLELVLKNPQEVRKNILNFFKGVRIDGSNATIIGDKSGEFKADRNKIVRVWSDHGAWPFVTVNFYIDRTGDTSILFEKQGYFKDKFAFYTKEIDPSYQGDNGSDLLTRNNIPYTGTVLEHILVENLAAYYNVGEHGNIRIEDADWNDGFDMASKLGETVSFTNLYIGNLKKIVRILTHLKETGTTHLSFFEEFKMLLNDVLIPSSPSMKQQKLKRYFEAVKHDISGKTITLPIEELITDLSEKAIAVENEINRNEWMEEGRFGAYNGYYDNNGIQVESLKKPVRLTLTGQVFPLMAHNATPLQIQKIHDTVKEYLYVSPPSSYRLNTHFGDNNMNLGRFMGFAFGHKENGAFFSHMTIMYAYALIDNDFVKEGVSILDDMAEYLQDINQSKILPGIPEYIAPDGRGMYHFLTGSASWVIITLVEQVFGIYADFGDFIIKPHLRAHHFRDGEASLNVLFQGKNKLIRFLNPEHLDYGEYEIKNAMCEDTVLEHQNNRVKLPKQGNLGEGEIIIELGEKK